MNFLGGLPIFAGGRMHSVHQVARSPEVIHTVIVGACIGQFGAPWTMTMTGGGSIESQTTGKYESSKMLWNCGSVTCNRSRICDNCGVRSRKTKATGPEALKEDRLQRSPMLVDCPEEGCT